MVQRAPSGVDVLVAPTRAVEAAAVVLAAASSVLPVLAALDQPVVLADGGRLRGGLSNLVTQSNVVVVAHRQHSGSAAAAALGIERVAELTSQLAARSIPTVVALIGSVPYTADEVSEFVQADVGCGQLPTIRGRRPCLPVAPAQPSGLRRSPLMRSLDELVGVVSASLRHIGPNDSWSRSFDDRSAERPTMTVDRVMVRDLTAGCRVAWSRRSKATRLSARRLQRRRRCSAGSVYARTAPVSSC